MTITETWVFGTLVNMLHFSNLIFSPFTNSSEKLNWKTDISEWNWEYSNKHIVFQWKQEHLIFFFSFFDFFFLTKKCKFYKNQTLKPVYLHVLIRFYSSSDNFHVDCLESSNNNIIFKFNKFGNYHCIQNDFACNKLDSTAGLKINNNSCFHPPILWAF